LQEEYIKITIAISRLSLDGNDLSQAIYLYYKIYDIENGTNHSEIFKTLYITKKYKTFDEVSHRFGVDIKTLYNYREKYRKLVKKLECITQKWQM